MKRKSPISRRKVLGSIAASGVAISATEMATATEDIPDIEVEEVTDPKAKRKIREVMNNDEWKNIERELRKDVNIRPDIRSATATKVREANGEERYVVSVPYDSEIEGDVEIFIQSSGLHQLDNMPDYWEESDPDIVGYDTRVKKPSARIEDNSESEDPVLESKTYYSEDGSTVSDSDEVELSTEPSTTDVGIQASSYEGTWYPVPSSGKCDNCKVETGVGCSPSRECLGRVASIVAGGIGCGSCGWAPSWYNPACWACVIAGFGQGLLGTLDCLGCDEIKDVCITDAYADDYCPYEDDPDPPDCLPGEPCPQP